MSELRDAVINVLDFLEFGGRRNDRVFHIDALKEALRNDQTVQTTGEVDCRQCQHLDRKKNCASSEPCSDGDKFLAQPVLQLYRSDSGEEMQR
jgi:hypothetical protein